MHVRTCFRLPPDLAAVGAGQNQNTPIQKQKEPQPILIRGGSFIVGGSVLGYVYPLTIWFANSFVSGKSNTCSKDQTLQIF